MAPLTFGSVRISETAGFPPSVPSGECVVYVTLNAEIALLARDSPRFLEILTASTTRVSVDGQWVLWGVRRKYPHVPVEKLSGSDLIFRLAAHCASHGEKLALLGSSVHSNAAAVARLRHVHPGLHIEGLSPPQFAIDQMTGDAVRAPIQAWIRKVRPLYVVVGFGTPKEVFWASSEVDLLRREGVVAVFCFGGAIDFASGSVRRAPVKWQRLGLEGVYRTMQQPQRWGRFLRVLRLLPTLITGRY